MKGARFEKNNKNSGILVRKKGAEKKELGKLVCSWAIQCHAN